MVARKGADVSIARLPATGGELFGREAELAWLDACWAERAHVAIVVAWGGVGKSALVNTWLARVRDDGWRGAERVYGWSFYSQGTDRAGSSDAFVDAALRWFGDGEPTQGSPWDKGQRLAGLVRAERTLLVLDGLEPLQWGPGVQAGRLKDPALQALVKELGAQNQGLCVITSRIAVADLEALGGDKVRAEDLGRLSAEAGAELLAARGAKGTAEELQQASIEYKGHGLALTLLGSYLADIAEGDIRRRREIGPLLVDEQHGGHARRVMAAYEAWLGKPEVAVLLMMGLFDRPVEPEEIAALRAEPVVLGLTDALAGVDPRAWNKAVAKLRRAGLLSVEEDKRLDAHPLVREHFGERLKRERVEAWREGHRRLYEHLKATAKELPENVEEMAPLYAAVVHGCAAGKNQEALVEVWWKRVQRGNEHFNPNKLGAFGSEIAVLSAFFAPPWEQLAPGLTEVWQAFVLNEAGYALQAQGRLSEAAGLMRSSLEQCIAQEHWKQAAIRASNLTGLLQTHGELTDAVAQARKGVELADKSGDAPTRVINRAALAAALHAMGLWEQAAAQFEEAERMQKAWQPADLLLYSVQGFQYCDLLLDQGRRADVRERATQTRVIAERNHWLLAIALDHLSLGRAHLLAAQRDPAADLAPAATHLHRAVDGLRRAGEQDPLPLGLLARAALRTHTRDFARARHDLDEALTLATCCGFRLHEADAHLGHARLALAEGHPAPALDHLAKARALIAATGYHRRDGELAELQAEAAATSLEREEGSRKGREERKDRKEERSEDDGFASFAAFARNSPAPQSPHASPENHDAMPDTYDIAIICALRTPELEKVVATGKQPWTKLPLEGGDPTAYRATTFERSSGPALSVVAAAPSQMGMPASAALATKMVQRFRPKLVAMVGIAGGVDRTRQGFGDILAPSTTFDYRAGKLTVRDGELHLSPDANPINIAHILRERLQEWVLEEERIGAIRRRWSGPKPNTVLKLHVGPLGSGSAVVAARETVEATKEHWRKLIGIEMEAYGVHHACQTVVHPPPMFLCMKSICDFAGPDKADDWQDYAAFTAAQLCHLFLTEEWDTLFPR